MGSTDGVYTKVLGLSIRREEDGCIPGSGHPIGTTIQPIRITLTYPTSSNSGNVTIRQLLLRLTSDTDPIFFYHLRLGELEYPALKQNQGLLVDFAGFPAQLMSLLEKCGDDKFQLVLRSGKDMTVLDIVESNPFKYLAHLSLFVVPGSDSEVKGYLAQVMLDLKRENEGMRAQIQHLYSSLQTELAKSKEEMVRKDLELGQLREEIRIESASKSEKYFREISSEKEKFIKLQADQTARFEAEKSDLEKRLRENMLTLESKYNLVDNEKRQLEQEMFRADSKIKSYESRIKSNEEDMKILNQDLQAMRKNNTRLDADYHEKQKEVMSVKADVKEKCGTIASQKDLISTLDEKVKVLEKKSKNLEREVDESRLRIRELEGHERELRKANDIIRKLQEDSRQAGKKIKAQTQILSSQEKQLSEKTEEVLELRQVSKTITSKTEGLQAELTAALKETDELKEKLKLQGDSLETKQDMIEWLNKQLNEFQGLSNLSKFRQNLNESSGSRVGGGGDTPSWMNLYNTSSGGGFNQSASARLLNPNNNSSSFLPQTTGNTREEVETNNTNKNTSLPATTTNSAKNKMPTWAKSTKVTLGAINKPTFPLWKK